MTPPSYITNYITDFFCCPKARKQSNKVFEEYKILTKKQETELELIVSALWTMNDSLQVMANINLKKLGLKHRVANAIPHHPDPEINAREELFQTILEQVSSYPQLSLQATDKDIEYAINERIGHHERVVELATQYLGATNTTIQSLEKNQQKQIRDLGVKNV